MGSSNKGQLWLMLLWLFLKRESVVLILYGNKDGLDDFRIKVFILENT